MARLARIAAVVLIIVGITALAVLARLRAGPGPATGERTLAGLDGPVEVLWDSLGIPQVWATTQHDAFRTQGWLHARDRMWQMEMFRRVSRGQLSEIFGEATVSTDRFLRMLDMNGAAEAAVGALDPASRDVLEAYVGGVNAAIDEAGPLLPPEFLILGIRPGAFTLADVMAMEKIMSWDLAEYGSTLDLLETALAIGVQGMEAVRPRYPADGPTIVPGTPDSTLLRIPETGMLPDAELVASARVPDAAEPFLAAVNAVHASNSWVVGGERSVSGKPLLSNDMHLGLSQPPLWYLMGLHAPGMNVVGMSLPGSPAIVAGHSDAVAWGLTNAMLDDTDLFLERVDPSDTTRYLTPDGSAPFEVRTELIEVKGREAPDTIVLRRTRHGPIVTPVESRAGGHLLAFQWVAYAPSTTVAAVLDMNRAASVDAFLEALSGFSTPHQNFVFADTAGAWGYWMGGRIPDRPTLAPPILPVPGWTGEYDWRGFLPFEAHPQLLEPAQGFIATGNNRQSWDSISARISADAWFGPWRAERIIELLAARDLHDAASMIEIQLDVVSTRTRRNLPHAVRAFREAGLDGFADRLEAWDASYPVDLLEPALFEAWMEGVTRGIRIGIYGGPGGYLSAARVDERLAEGSVPDSILLNAAVRAAELAPGMPWGEVHTVTLDHPLASVQLLETVFGFGERGISRAGNAETVNVARGVGPVGDWIVGWGPSQRHVVDLADLDGTGGFILPGGQSGYPAGEHSLDQVGRWKRGELVRMPMSREAVERSSVGRLTLRPPG